MRLEGKAAIITGSGQGIGREMATVFVEEGAAVVIADVQGDLADRAAGELRSEGFEVIGVEVDITDSGQVDAMVVKVVDAFGRIDVLVNNAGIGLSASFLETTPEDWERVIRTNLTGTFLCSQAVARVMVAQGEGRIVNVGSISGQRGAQNRAAYGASKAGVIQLTRVMAVELAAKGVRVNAISPGPVDTYQSRTTHTEATRRAYLDRMPIGRYGERREIAAAALFLASEESGFVVGHILNVDGGFGSAGLRFDPEEE